MLEVFKFKTNIASLLTFTGLLVMPTFLHASELSSDYYDKYFKNEYLVSKSVSGGELNLQWETMELVWNEQVRYWNPLIQSSRNIAIPLSNEDININPNDLLVGDSLLARNIIKTNKGKTLFTAQDYSDSIEVNLKAIPSHHGKIPSFFYKKRNSEINQVVVYLHGGSFQDCLSDTIFPKPELHALLDNNTAIYAINTTGDFDCEDKYDSYPNTINRRVSDWATTEINDIFTAYDIAKENYPNLPIFLMGFSHGSYLTNLIASKYAAKSKYDGYISMMGAWDNSQEDNYSHNANPERFVVSDRHFHQENCSDCLQGFVSAFTYNQTVSQENGKTTMTIDEKLSHKEAVERLKEIRRTEDIDFLYYRPLDSFYEKTNPALHIGNINKPFLSVHGVQDKTVLIFNSHALEKNLTPEQKSLVEVLRYQEEGHGLFTRKNFNDFVEKLLSFVSRLESIN